MVMTDNCELIAYTLTITTKYMVDRIINNAYMVIFEGLYFVDGSSGRIFVINYKVHLYPSYRMYSDEGKV